jgi:hypothetical protein
MGDSSPAADKLMRSQGVRALPSFHFVSRRAHTHPSRRASRIRPGPLPRMTVRERHNPRGAIVAHSFVLLRPPPFLFFARARVLVI